MDVKIFVAEAVFVLGVGAILPDPNVNSACRIIGVAALALYALYSLVRWSGKVKKRMRQLSDEAEA